MSSLFGFLFGLGPMEIAVIVVLAVLLFGKNLPGVGRSIGKSIVEFKKGMKGLEDEFEGGAPGTSASQAAPEQIRPPQRVAATAPKFEDSPTSVTANPPKA